ncbi:hypothetical protein HK24_09780, partial [Gluconobacter sp. DsW_058]
LQLITKSAQSSKPLFNIKETRLLHSAIPSTKTEERESHRKPQNQTVLRSLQVTESLRYLGLPGRKNDAVTLAFGTNHVNSRLSTLYWYQDGKKGPRRNSEFAIETDYTFQATKWLYLEPNVQFWVDPGGYTQKNMITVFGVKTGVTF